MFGFLPVLRSTFGLVPLWGHGIWLRAVVAAACGYFGLNLLVTGRQIQRFTTEQKAAVTPSIILKVDDVKSLYE